MKQLWPLVSLKLSFFTPTKKPSSTPPTPTADGRRCRRYDQPKTPWQRVGDSGILTDGQIATVGARIVGVNPADLTRQINHIRTT